MNKQQISEAEGDRHRYRKKHTNTSNYWQGEYFKNAYGRSATKNFGKSLTSGLLAGWNAASIRKRGWSGGKAKKAGTALRAGLMTAFGYESAHQFTLHRKNHKMAQRYEAMQHDMIRAEMKKQGYKGKPQTRNADLAMAKTVKQFNSQKVKFGYPDKTAYEIFHKMKEYD